MKTSFLALISIMGKKSY